MTLPLAPSDETGARTLEVLADAPRYNAWMYEAIAPFLGRRILEVGSGIGTMSELMLSAGPERMVLTDLDPWYRSRLARRFANSPVVRIDELKLPDPTAAARLRDERLDTIVALNVVEHIEDDVGALASMRGLLGPAGRVVVLVPALARLYGTLDVELGHFRRYGRRRLRQVFAEAGLQVGELRWFNRVGTLGWWLNGQVRRRRRIERAETRLFDAMVPILRFERFLPLPFGQSLIAVGTPNERPS